MSRHLNRGHDNFPAWGSPVWGRSYDSELPYLEPQGWEHTPAAVERWGAQLMAVCTTEHTS